MPQLRYSGKASAMCASVCLAVFLTVADSAAAQPTVRPDPRGQSEILLLFSEDATQPWTQRVAQGFADVAAHQVPGPVLYYEYLDIARFHDPSDLDAFRDWLKNKYQRRDVDILMPLGEPAMDFVASHRETLWPGASIFFLATREPDATMRARLGDAGGLILEDNLGSTLEVLKTVLPGTNRVMLLRGLSPSEREFTHTVPDVARHAGLEYAEMSGLTMPEFLTRVRNIPAGTLVMVGGPLVDRNGHVMLAPSLCREISAAASVPIFMLGAQNLGCGILGGALRDFTIVGQRIAAGALNERTRHTVAVLRKESFTSIVFDARQLERWGISESRLPAGSTVAFRKPSLWRDYRRDVLVVFSAIVIQFVLIAGLLYERRHRRHAEAANQQNLLVAARAARITAMGELTASIAHELAQPLGAILHNVEAVKLMLESNRTALPEIRAILTEVAEQDLRAREILTRIRMLVQKRPFEASPIDVNAVVADTLRIVATEASSRGVDLQQQLTAAPCIVVADRIQLQQVLLNLVLNAMEAMTETPASRRRIVVDTVAKEGGIALSVRDAGPGVPADVAARLFAPFVTTKPDGLGIGLSIARSIVTAHGGRIDIENGAGGGVTARVWLPLAAAAA